MKVFNSSVLEIHQSHFGNFQAKISLPPGKIPQPGQYFQAHRLNDKLEPLPVTLYPGGLAVDEELHAFTTAPPIPPNWQPGDELLLRGPLGKGFQLPRQTKSLALASLDGDGSQLLPIANQVLSRGGEVAFFTDHSYPYLPTQVEISPLSSLENALPWADFLAVCGNPDQVIKLQAILNPEGRLPCPVQVLVIVPMPCGGLGSCGICALPDRQGKTLLACEDGPVFDWDRLTNLR